jgi:RimJ/RimL family protein N-acetyltransferase
VRWLGRRSRGAAREDVAPERIELESLHLRRLVPADAPALALAAQESLEHLRPWMPWATPDGVTSEAQERRLSGRAAHWGSQSDYEYGIFLAGGALVGGCGLHRRIGPSALEIGYWVHAAHTRRGIATAAAGALTAAGFSLARVERMEIHCDEANVASAAVPPKLGYRLHGRVPHPPEAPGEVGTRLVWVQYRREFDTRPGADGPEREASTEL